ncbi:ATP-binding protein [Lentzea sp.]|uniref:ATP-binding protein n=1 Tax=Lentzea sp. TaxID=56099 RepID=UPI002ED5D40D
MTATSRYTPGGGEGRQTEVPLGEPGTTVAALTVADDLSEMARVRNWARGLLADLPEDRCADVVIVLDELVSNALRHGEPPREVRLVRRGGWMRIEVDDGCRDEACQRPAYNGGGRGIALIAACSLAWGQEQRQKGKTVWAELTLTDAG